MSKVFNILVGICPSCKQATAVPTSLGKTNYSDIWYKDIFPHGDLPKTFEFRCENPCHFCKTHLVAKIKLGRFVGFINKITTIVEGPWGDWHGEYNFDKLSSLQFKLSDSDIPYIPKTK